MCGIVFFGSLYYRIHQHIYCFSWGYRVCFHPLRGVFSPPSMPPWISCLGSLCSPCGIATSIILGLWVVSLPLRNVLILVISAHEWADLLSRLCKSYLLFTMEYQGTPLFLLKKVTEYLQMILSPILRSINWVFYIFAWGNKLN